MKQITERINITKYLVGGELKTWAGDKSKVFSVIKNDNNLPTHLGSIPSLDEDTAISAVEQADIAYNRGRGKWPTMSVQKRIDCMQKFVDEMAKYRHCLLYTSPSPRDGHQSRMPSSA